MNCSAFLLLDELHQDNTIRNISKYAQQWRPQLGLGVIPGAPSPRYWTSEDLLERDFGSPIPTLAHHVMHLDTDYAGVKHARETMAGCAGLIYALHAEPATQLLNNWCTTLQPTIKEEGLAVFPVYVPLMNAGNIGKSSAEDLARWMGDAQVYIRESLEDLGVVILSTIPLATAFNKANIMVPDLAAPRK